MQKMITFFRTGLSCVPELIRECLNSHKITLSGGLFGILVGLSRSKIQRQEFLNYLYIMRIKKRFSSLYELEGAGEINSQIGQIKRELKLFYTRERREWASPCLDFIERNSKGLSLYKRLPEKEIEHTNNAAEIMFSLFKPQYKVMKEFQIPWGAQAHFNFFTLRHNFRVFPRGKRKGYSPLQLEGLNYIPERLV